MRLPQPFRLAKVGHIDRAKSLRFRFDGREFTGFQGDTLASALLANGVRFVGRSFKYHRPRGILSAGPEEPNALVELRSGARREPNTRATVIELFDGLEAKSQNRWPSLAWDILAFNSLAAPILKAGFYYKTFMWPASFWEKVYEPLIRRSAGLGRAAGEEDPDHYEKAFAFCDLLIIGGGPAGLAAALSAGRAGARVILADEDFSLGGRLLADAGEINGTEAADWTKQAEEELKSLPEVRIMRRTTVFGVYDHGQYGAVERVSDHLPEPGEHQPRQRSWRIIAKRAVLAAGSLERPIVFGGNDRPGVMLAGAVRAYVNRFGVAPGRKAVIFTSGDDAYRTASCLAAAGVAVSAIVDARSDVSPALAEAAKRSGTKLMTGSRVVATKGKPELTGVEVINGDGRVSSLSCDLLAMSNGWNPTVHLTCHLGSKPVWDAERAIFVPGKLPAGMTVAGAAAGLSGLGAALSSGTQAGREAAIDLGLNPPAPENWQTEDQPSAVSPVWHVAGSRGKAFADFQNDVTADDLELAAREGFKAAEHAKRYTTLGMATDQGKTSNVLALGILAGLNGESIARTGTTTFRPPYTPVAIGALAGHHRGKHFRPTRLTPSHGWAKEQGAVFVEAGQWLRAQYFPRSGEKDWLDTVNREVMTVRSGVGVCDVSTLGKIDIQGRDAAEFLERVYINAWKSLPIGKCRYGLMLREDGFVMDDGTTARLGETHFFMTTTTANAGKVMQHLEFCHQALWPELDVHMVSVTEQWAQFSVAGPQAREVLKGVIDPGHDISDAVLPYLGCCEVTAGGGVPARLYRISFSGEMAYEIGVPTAYGDALIRAIMAAGEPYGICPYGTEALGVMRIEKGHVGGGEINGHTTARDLGLGKMMSRKKDFIGRLMAERPALTDPERPQLVGFKPVDARERLRAGAHFVPIGKPVSAENDEGYMTSAAFSPSLGHWIGLGLLRRGPERIGEEIIIADPVRGSEVKAFVCHPCFIDPEGKRVHG